MKTLSRRHFLKSTVIGGAAVAAMGLVGCSSADDEVESSSVEETSEESSVDTSQIADANSGASDGLEQSEGFIAESVAMATADPATFLPLKPAGSTGKCIMNEIYNPVADQDGASGDLYGVIAKDWYWDGNDLYVELYDYVHDADDNPLTASDIVYYYERMAAEGYDDLKYSIYCDGCEVVSDYEMVFHFKEDKSDVYMNINNMLRGSCVVTQAAFEASADMMATNPVGTGPYKLVSYTSGSSAVLERDENYWQTDADLVGPQHKANVQTITYYFISDTTQIVNALRTGDIDYAENIPSTAYDEFNDSDEYTVQGYYTGRMGQTFFNCKEGAPFSDINLRAAVCYAINSDDIVAAIGGEQFARRLHCFCTPSVALYDEECETWDNYYHTCDLDLAKEYLSKASGYEGKTLQIYYQNTEHVEMEEAISLCIGAALDQLGLSYSIQPSSDIDNVNIPSNTDWDIILNTQGGNGTAMSYFNRWNLEIYEGGMGNWYDETMNEMYAKFNTNSGATVENHMEIQQYLIDNFYTYGTIEVIQYDCWRSSVIESANTKTFRTWAIPGAWIYKE